MKKLLFFTVLFPINMAAMQPEELTELDQKLLEAAKKGQVDLIRDLIKEGANVNAKDSSQSTPLKYAAARGKYEAVKELIENGANINEPYALILNAAMGSRDENIVALLLKNGANVNARDRTGRTPLMRAAENYGMGIIKLLIKYDADINAKATDLFAGDPTVYTAALLARKRGHGPIANYLEQEQKKQKGEL